MASSAPAQSISITSALHVLRKINPPQSIIHVGAGQGTGPMQQWQQWNIENAWIVDADPDCLPWAEALRASHPDWHVICVILCESHGKAIWHEASNPDERGLINPEYLQSLWPNLQCTGREERITQSLDNVLADCGAIPDESWLFIDCLPALPILKGAGLCLDHCSVLWLRVLLTPLANADKQQDNESLTALEAWLKPLGYRCIAIQEGNHPAVGHALFARNWQGKLQQQIQTLTEESERQKQQASESDQQLQTVTAQNAALDKEKLELAAQRDALQKELAAIKQARELEAGQTKDQQLRIEELNKTNDEQSQLVSKCQNQVAELEKQIGALTKAKQDLEQQNATALKQRDEVQKEFASIKSNADEQARLASKYKSELEQAQAQSKQKDQHITQLQADLTERDARQQMLNDEMTRAEAQIDLIKDVLFREPGL